MPIPAIILLVFYLQVPVSFHDGLMSVFFAAFIFFLSLDTSSLARGLSKKVFVLLGELSYSLYILQFPVYKVVSFVFKSKGIDMPQLMFYTYLIILLLISFICYYKIEVVIRDWIRDNFMVNKSHRLLSIRRWMFKKQ